MAFTTVHYEKVGSEKAFQWGSGPYLRVVSSIIQIFDWKQA